MAGSAFWNDLDGEKAKALMRNQLPSKFQILGIVLCGNFLLVQICRYNWMVMIFQNMRNCYKS